MPLSEQEQRLLEEMERSLYQNDADFVATVSKRRGKPNYTVIVVGVLVGLAGVIILVSGVIVLQPLVGLFGFVIMFAGVLVAAAPPRRVSAADAQPKGRTGTGDGTSSRFMDNLNDRWDKRQDGHGH